MSAAFRLLQVQVGIVSICVEVYLFDWGHRTAFWIYLGGYTAAWLIGLLDHAALRARRSERR